MDLRFYLSLAYGFVIGSLLFFAFWTRYRLKKAHYELSQAQRNAISDVP
ncbi:MAG: hypothetical protein K2P90_01205 [Holosporales bacterium]|nr:hypothetical protein [Holosporales bacterium]